MIAEDFLARLEKVRKSGARSWMARCPSHADKGPSLKISDVDGKILIHCHAGCTPYEVTQACGVNLADLFPPRDRREAAMYAREKFAKATIAEMRHEVTVACIIMCGLAKKKALNDADAARALKARDSLFKFLREMPS